MISFVDAQLFVCFIHYCTSPDLQYVCCIIIYFVYMFVFDLSWFNVLMEKTPQRCCNQ